MVPSESLQQWSLLVHEVNGRSVVGMPGVRDPDFPCDAYRPTPDADLLGLRVTAAGDGDCASDGHYLCGGCEHLSASAFERRTTW